VAQSIANTLLLTLVSLMDEALDGILRGRGLKPGRYPTDKLAQLEKALPKTLLSDNRWAFAGAREAIILRNVLVHSSGTWNAESIEQLRSLVAKTPPQGKTLQISFGDLFRFKRAVRTTLNLGLPSNRSTQQAGRRRARRI
jgi:hypothetical protein